MSLALRGRAGAAMVVGVALVLVTDWATSSNLATLVGAGFVVALASSEFYDLVQPKGLSAFKPFGMAAAITLILLPSLSHSRGWGGLVAAFVCFLLWWLAFRLLFRPQRTGGDFGTRIALTSLGVVYVGGLASFWGWIRLLPNGLAALCVLVILAKSGDLAAYVVGSSFGRHKLASKVSPNKSLEGAAANMVVSVLLALIIVLIWRKPFERPSDALLFGLLVSTAAQLGDLLESKIKRAFGAKDSSSMIPGFGGVLDVIDSVLVAAPMGYFVLILLR